MRQSGRNREASLEQRRQVMIETTLLGLVTVALLVYLVYALLRPEKF
jgi:K+-transporting ATPase KdpF subunit